MRRFLTIVLWIALSTSAPLSGAAVFGLWERRFLAIPPRQLPIGHADFSWVVWAGLALGIALFLFPFVSRIIDMKPTFARPRKRSRAFFRYLSLGC